MAIIKNPIMVVEQSKLQKNGEFWVKVIDYDGTILKEDWLDTGDTFILPKPPTHDRLTFQEWASPVEITDSAITVGHSDIVIGATYITTSGNDEFDIELNDRTGLHVEIRSINVSSTQGNTRSLSISWGDGTTDNYSVTSGSNHNNYSHTYQQEGNYTIEIGATGTFSFYFNNSIGDYGLFMNEAGDNIYCCKHARLGLQQHTSLLRMFQNAFLLETVTIPKMAEPYTSFGNAFYACNSLKACVIPNSVETISDYSFYGCSNLINVVIPQSVDTVGDNAFSSCYKLSSITIPNNTAQIEYSAFSGCYELNGINLSESSLPKIENNSFSSCRKIESVKLPSTITSIDSSAFSSCYNLKTVDLSDCVNLTSIAGSAFLNNYKLETIILPDSLTNIGNYSFSGCYNLYVKNYGNANYMPSYSTPYFALKSCTNTHITSCSIHSDCKIISSNAFQNCFYLETVSLPEGLLQIGYGAFRSCRELQSITFPNTLKKIDNYAFPSCRSLTELVIPASVESIGGQCFQNCSGLLSVTYQGQTSDISNSQYSGCNAVTKYDFRNCTTIPTLSNVSYLGHATGCQIIIPDALYNEWTTATNWVSLTNVVWVKASEVSDD